MYVYVTSQKNAFIKIGMFYKTQRLWVLCEAIVMSPDHVYSYGDICKIICFNALYCTDWRSLDVSLYIGVVLLHLMVYVC